MPEASRVFLAEVFRSFLAFSRVFLAAALIVNLRVPWRFFVCSRRQRLPQGRVERTLVTPDATTVFVEGALIELFVFFVKFLDGHQSFPPEARAFNLLISVKNVPPEARD